MRAAISAVETDPNIAVSEPAHDEVGEDIVGLAAGEDEVGLGAFLSSSDAATVIGFRKKSILSGIRDDMISVAIFGCQLLQ